jgi:hypothetical protein
MSRYRAFAIHFALSLAVFAALAALLLLVWYPDFLFATDGGWQGIRILAAVDLVLGPLLTLIVFKSGKPGLRFDLSCIAAVQTACLAAGLYVVHDERPVALVYVDGSFFSMSRDDYLEVGVTPPSIGLLERPAWYAVDVPSDPHAQADLRLSMMHAGRPLRVLTERYRPFDPISLPHSDATDVRLLEDLDRESGALVDWRAEHADALGDYAFYLYGARYGYRYLGFEKATGRFAGVLEVNAPV